MRTWWSKIKGRAKVFSQLRRPGEWWVFARVLVFAAAVPLLFRWKVSAWSRLLHIRLGRRGAAVRPGEEEVILRCVELAIGLGRPVVRNNCLTRGVTRYVFLRRAGVDVSLCFGAASKEGELLSATGHCWLVRGGRAYLEASEPLSHFVPIYLVPAGALPASAATGAEGT